MEGRRGGGKGSGMIGSGTLLLPINLAFPRETSASLNIFYVSNYIVPRDAGV
jgi:hypothetical protein